MTHLMLSRWQDDVRGTAGIEYALVLPVFLMLAIGVINTSQLVNVVNSMHFAVQEAARCSAVDAITCSSAEATAAYARRRYSGLSVTPRFVATNEGCG